MSRFFLRLFNGLFSLVFGVVLLVAGCYAGYALWDNNRIYTAAENVQAELLTFKPKVEETTQEEGPSFAQLLAINEDVVAWVTLDGTAVDYPILQGETTMEYLNKDVYGNFALAGSIFVDSRCTPEYSEPYWLVYGHDMTGSRMFGDLALYKDAKFFAENRTGVLMLPEKVYSLKVFACILIEASDDLVFEPEKGPGDLKELLVHAQQNAVHTDEDEINALLTRLEEGDTPKIIALTTCSAEFTNARTVILCEVTDYVASAEEDVEG